MILLNSMQSILTLLLMILIGYVLTSKGWFDEKISSLFTKLVINVSLPLYMVSNLMSTFNKDKLSHLASGFIFPFIIILTSYCISMLVAAVLKIDKNKRGTFYALFAFSNTMFIGLPVNQGLFGEEAIPYVLIYYVANTSLFWTIGNYGISKDGSKNNDEGSFKSFFTLSTFKRIFSPPLLGFLTGVILIFLGVKLPPFILDTCKYIGNLTTPLAMFFTGIAMHSISIKEIKVDLSMFAIIIGRFIISPLIALFVVYHSPLNIVLMKKVFVIQTALPVMTQISILAKIHNSDYKRASIMATLTTVMGLIVIPIYMYITSFLL